MVDTIVPEITTTNLSSSKDRDEIVRVIEAESKAWLKGDIKEWKTCWVQEPHAQHTNARPFLGVRLLHGFDEIERYFTPYFATIAEEGRSERDIKHSNWRINIGVDIAWVTFDQILPVDTQTIIASGKHNQMRILEKVDGVWKIAAVLQVPNRYGYYSSPWVRIDGKCRIVDIGPGLFEALEGAGPLKVVGNRLFGHSTADTEKLHEAVMQADTNLQDLCSRPPFPLVLSDPDGQPLPPCWVTIADMMIVILLYDDQLLINAVARAGEVFGLTAKQVCVAESIARGHNLSITARQLQVRPSTVRTHLRRMYERLNVKSQPALVRSLLSVSPPL